MTMTVNFYKFFKTATYIKQKINKQIFFKYDDQVIHIKHFI